jgi:NADH-quinone oxidoreductase subunit M
LCGFPGEVFVVLASFEFSPVLAIISATVVILTAGYILWAVQRVYLGAEYKGPHEEALVPSTLRENTIATVLFVLAILLGVVPYHTVLRYMDKTVEAQAESLTEWTIRREATTMVAADDADQDPEPARVASEPKLPVDPQAGNRVAPAIELTAVTVPESPPSATDQPSP